MPIYLHPWFELTWEGRTLSPTQKSLIANRMFSDMIRRSHPIISTALLPSCGGGNRIGGQELRRMNASSCENGCCLWRLGLKSWYFISAVRISVDDSASEVPYGWWTDLIYGISANCDDGFVISDVLASLARI